MDPLDKLDIILSSVIAAKKRQVQQGRAEGMNAACIYLNGIDNQIKAYQDSLAFVRQMKRNAPSMSDESAKMYGKWKVV